MSVPGAAYLMKLPPAERQAAVERALDGMREATAEMIAEKRRPKSFKGQPAWKDAILMVVQHAAGPNSITVSHDGRLDGAWRLPLVYTKGPRAGQPITRIHHTEIKFEPMPLELGFLIIVVPGWLASKQGLCQAAWPHLSDDVEWSEQQREAWTRLRHFFEGMNTVAEKRRNEAARRRAYNAERAERIASGRCSVSDLAYGARR